MIKRVSNAEYLKAKRLKAVAEGKCYVCRARPQKPGSRSCVECLARTAERKKMLSAAGLCACGARTMGSQRCPSCAFVARCLMESLIASEVAAGNCQRCKQPRERADRVHCDECRRRECERQRARSAA